MEILQADVAVIACGPSGLAAAISAAEAGLRVVALEKAMNTGGAANMGMGPLGLNTTIQTQELSNVTVDKAFRMFMEYTHWRVDANIVKQYFEKSADTIAWPQDMGVEFFKASRYFPGSEPTWHIVKPESGKPGPRAAGTMIKRMTERATALGVQILFETPAEHLIVEDGKITGVQARDKDGNPVQVNCSAAVVCTGGFGANAELVREKTGYVYDKDFFGFRIPGLMGDGMRMTTEVGGATTDISMELVVSCAGEHMTDPIRAAITQPNLLVNLQGERFFNEEFFENATFAANAVNIQKDRCGIMVLDEAIKRYYVKHGIDVRSMVLNRENAEGFDEDFAVALASGNPYIFKADTLEELAEKAGINVKTFLETVDTYNYYCETYDAQFGKRQDYMRPIVKAPFYAAKFFPGAYGTLGGIKVNHYMEVIKPDFDPIPGLYAAGTDTCTIYGDSYMFLLPGNTMGYALNSGRMAGENAAGYVKSLR